MPAEDAIEVHAIAVGQRDARGLVVRRDGHVHRDHDEIYATDLDERAVACAKRNGVEAYLGDLFDAIPPGIEGRVDVLAAVVPYVPKPELQYLQSDTFTFETPLAYLGGKVALRTPSAALERVYGAAIAGLGIVLLVVAR